MRSAARRMEEKSSACSMMEDAGAL